MALVLEKVRTLVAEQFDVDEEDIGADTTFEELGADSFDIAELVAALEEEFDIELPAETAERIATVGDAAAAVRRNLPKS